MPSPTPYPSYLIARLMTTITNGNTENENTKRKPCLYLLRLIMRKDAGLRRGQSVLNG